MQTPDRGHTAHPSLGSVIGLHMDHWFGYDLRAVSPSICASVTTNDISQNQVRIRVPKNEAGRAVCALARGERGAHVWCQAQHNICDWQCLRSFSISVVRRQGWQTQGRCCLTWGPQGLCQVLGLRAGAVIVLPALHTPLSTPVHSHDQRARPNNYYLPSPRNPYSHLDLSPGEFRCKCNRAFV